METEPVGGVDKDAGKTQVPPGFERALEGLRATGASTTMRDLVELLARHGSMEGQLLDDYKRLCETTTDPAARYLIDLIMEDEQRHHQMLVEMATSMAWDTLNGVETSVPPLGWQMDEDLLAATRRLREQEDVDRHELQTLRKRLRSFEETTLWALIVDVMILDTQKHAAILQFLERHSRGI